MRALRPLRLFLCQMLAMVAPAAPPLERLRSCVERSDSVCASAALSDLDKGPASVRESLEYLELASHSLLLQDRHEDALLMIEKALRQSPNEYRYLLIQGRIQQKLGAHPSAIRSFLLAQKAQPKSAEVYFLIGMSFFLEEEYARAVRHFQHVTQLEPANDKALFMLGAIHAYRAELSEAAVLFRKAVDLQPRNAHYRLHYGVLLDRDDRDQEALSEVRRAVELDPKNPLAQYHLGRLLADRGELELARSHLEQAAKLKPTLAQVYYRLHIVYRRLGMQAQAGRTLTDFQHAKAAEQKELGSGPDTLLLDPPAR